MKRLLNVPVLAILAIALSVSTCDKYNDDDIVHVVEYPSIKVVNETRDNYTITSIRLLGYDFTNLNIDTGSSQTFTLDKGMSGGYSDIYVKVGLGMFGTLSTTVDFYEGETTTITLKGCLRYEGCPGLSLE